VSRNHAAIGLALFIVSTCCGDIIGEITNPQADYDETVNAGREAGAQNNRKSLAADWIKVVAVKDRLPVAIL